MKTIACAVLVIVLGWSTSAFAQRRGGGSRAGVRAPAVTVGSAQGTLLLFTALLDLTDTQQAQVRTVFSAGVDAAGSIGQQGAPGPQALYEAVKAGASDDEIRGLASQAGTRAMAVTVLQAQTFAKVWALLTDAQKAKMDFTMYDDIGQFLTRPSSPVGLR
ncbi:MAG TPA: Spy/CpxP family protein refolding chaperone [Vicinamibacterales bacterium]|jgi:Spy/CpxP family protein refolding chaperone|nr:Spy/CpxP family protein refolding chaperone [Vicinamibacterales bacterium]